MNTQTLWQAQTVVDVMQGTVEHKFDCAFNGISIDNRNVVDGDLFFAILGVNQDGHDYVERALEAGALAAVVSRSVAGVSDARLIHVGDTLQALNQLGIAARHRTAAKIIAITGSVGKTGTKDALQLALAACGRVHASVQSYNNQWGVPLSLARCPAATQFGIFEIGMNHRDEITPLVKMVRPHIAIITTIAPVHLGYFSSLDQIAQAKAEIFHGLMPGATAILNRDNAYFDYLSKAAGDAGAGEIIGFGENDKAGARLISCRLGPGNSVIRADIMGEVVEYEIGAPGKHLVMNSLAVLAAVAAAGADIKTAASTLRQWRAPIGRGARHNLQVKGQGFVLVDESYNGNPTSMRAALATLGRTDVGEKGRKIAVLGDMLELGAQAEDLHKDLAKPLMEAKVDLVFAAGPHMQSLWNELPEKHRGAFAATAAEIEQNLINAILPGDVVMIKGSLGSRMGSLVDALLTHFR